MKSCMRCFVIIAACLLFFLLVGCTSSRVRQSSGYTNDNTLYDRGYSSAEYIRLPAEINGNLGKTNSYKIRWYRFEITDETVISLKLSIRQSGQDFDMALLDRNQNQLSRSAAAGNSDENINFKAAPGLYYIKVYLYSGGGGAYSLTVKKSYPPLVETFRSDAVNLASGERVNGTVGRGSGVKDRWFRIDVNTASRIELALNIGATGQDLDMELKGTNNSQLARSTGSTTEEKISYSAPAGTYYLRIYACKDTDGSPFTLSLKRYLPIMSGKTQNKINKSRKKNGKEANKELKESPAPPAPLPKSKVSIFPVSLYTNKSLVTLKWQSNPPSQKCELLLSAGDSSFKNATKYLVDKDNHKTFTLPRDNSKFFWRVRGFNGESWGEWSDKDCFYSVKMVPLQGNGRKSCN